MIDVRRKGLPGQVEDVTARALVAPPVDAEEVAAGVRAVGLRHIPGLEEFFARFPGLAICDNTLFLDGRSLENLASYPQSEDMREQVDIPAFPGVIMREIYKAFLENR